MSLLKDKIEIGIQEAELGTQKALGSVPLIIRLVIILLVLGIIPSYYIARSLSQKIWLSRYEQGAVLAKMSFTNPQAPSISPVHVTSLGGNSFAAAVQISNPNSSLSLDQVPDSFTFYNAQKQQIYTFNDTLYILPNQTKYLTVPTFTTTEKIAYADFTLPKSLPWQHRLNTPAVSLITSIPSNFEQYSPVAMVVQGDFSNNSPYTLKQVALAFLLFDSSDQIIGVSSRDEFTVMPFERRSYKQLWPNLVAPNLSKVEVDAYTNTLDPADLIIDNSNSPASDLSRPVINQ